MTFIGHFTFIFLHLVEWEDKKLDVYNFTFTNVQLTEYPILVLDQIHYEFYLIVYILSFTCNGLSMNTSLLLSFSLDTSSPDTVCTKLQKKKITKGFTN